MRSNQIDIATEFVDGEPIRGEAGDERADQVSEDGQNVPTAVFGLLGSVLVAFLFVMLPLRARRVGLMSPFMGILGVIAGILLVLPLLPGVPVIIQAFWLGALGLLFLGNWPGGRGPAWETGEAVPWPSPASSAAARSRQATRPATRPAARATATARGRPSPRRSPSRARSDPAPGSARRKR